MDRWIALSFRLLHYSTEVDTWLVVEFDVKFLQSSCVIFNLPLFHIEAIMVLFLYFLLCTGYIIP